MRLLLACSILAAACGSSSSSHHPDGSSGGDGSGTGGDGSGSGGGTTVSITITNAPTNAAMFTFLVAYQDGAGAWALAPAPSGGVYSFTVQSPAWGFAYTCIGTVGGTGIANQVRQVIEAHFAVSERTSLTLTLPPRCTDANPMNVGLAGTIQNRMGGGNDLVDFGNRTAVATGQDTYAMETPPGTRDAIMLHVTSGGNAGDFTADGAVLARDLAVTAATMHDFDEDTAVATQTFPVLATTAGRITATTLLYTANGTTATIARNTTQLVTGSLAASQMAAGDVYDQQIQVAGSGQTATVTNATATPAAQTYAAPAPLGGATATVPATTPYPEVKTTWGAYTGAVGYTWTATQTLAAAQCGGQTACTVTWAAALSPGVTGGSPSYTMPDLSALTGWSASLQLVTGTMVTGTVEAMTSTAGAMDFPAGVPAAGTQRVLVRSDYTVTP